MTIVTDFTAMVRQRSEQNRAAFCSLEHAPQVQVALLRIELDSLIRVLHVLSYKPPLRAGVIREFYSKQRFENEKGKRITDAHMVEEATKFKGWTRYVYDFACAFVHLSPLHLNELDGDLGSYFGGETEKVKHYLSYYHGFDVGAAVSIRTLTPYLGSIFEKICENTECYLRDIEEGHEPPAVL